MLPRSRRVTTRLVKEIVAQSRPLHGRFLYIRYMAMSKGMPKNGDKLGIISEKAQTQSLFSVIVPKNVEKSSVGRHRLKRKINESLKKSMISWPEGFAIVIFAKETAKKALRDEIEKDGMSLLSKIKL